MKMEDAIKFLGIGKTAFYRWCSKLAIKGERGDYSEGQLMTIYEAKQKAGTTGKPKEYYRVSINEGYGWTVVRAGLSKAKAKRIMTEYRIAHTPVKMLPCLFTKKYLRGQF